MDIIPGGKMTASPEPLKLDIQGCALPEAKKQEKNLAQKFVFSKQKITRKELMEINSAFWIKMEPFHDKGMHLFRTIQAAKEEKGKKNS